MTEKGRKIIARGKDVELPDAGARGRGRRVTLIDPSLGFDTRCLNLHYSELPPGAHTVSHRETQEHIMYILSGKGYNLIDDKKYEWEAGDALFIPSWSWHQYWNTDPTEPARYLVATNTPMVKNLGLDKSEWEEEPRG